MAKEHKSQEVKPEELEADSRVAGDWARVLEMIPVDIEESARTHQALQRCRKVRSGATLLRIVLAYALCDWSFRLTGAWAAIQEKVSLAPKVVRQRVMGSEEWLRYLVTQWLAQRGVVLPVEAVRVRLVDASGVSAPGSTGTDWRLPLSFDLARGWIDGVEVTDARGGETLVRWEIREGDIVLVDRGYAHRRGIGHVVSQYGRVVVRVNVQNVPLEDEAGHSIDLVAWLQRAAKEGPAERLVWVVTPQGRFPLRLVAAPLPEEAANGARRRVRENGRKKGHTPTQETLAAAGFVILLTNLPVEEWGTVPVLALYRLRWQVEKVFHRLKSLWHLDRLRAKDPAVVQAYLLGKILGALIAEEMTGQARRLCPGWFAAVERPVSQWRLQALWREVLCGAVRGPLTLADCWAAWPQLQRYLCDTPRRRRQQQAAAVALFQSLSYV
jgi:hypothetical protein